MNSPQIFKLINGVQRTVRYFYIVLFSMMVYVSVRGYMTSGTEWVNPLMRVLMLVELFLVTVYIGIIICIKAFSKIGGEVLGTEISVMIEFWGWLGDKVKDMLVYNGMLGFIMFSLYF